MAQNLQNTLLINVVLAVFNMLPLPPLMRKKIPGVLKSLERYGLI